MAENNNKTSQAETMREFSDVLLQINFDDPAKKQDKDYGRKLLQRIYREQTANGTTYYYGGRNIRWRENRLWSQGKQPMDEFKDYMSVSGTKAYTNIDFTPPRKGAELTETLVTYLSSNEEYPSVNAIDDKSIDEKTRQKQDALYRMHDRELIKDLHEKSGIQLEPVDAFTPDTELEATVKFEIDFRTIKEIDFERSYPK